MNDALRHHLPPPTSLVLCQSASQPVTYFGQAAPQVVFRMKQRLKSQHNLSSGIERFYMFAILAHGGFNKSHVFVL